MLSAGAVALGACLAGCTDGSDPAREPAGPDDGQAGDESDGDPQQGTLEATVAVAPDGRPVFEPSSVEIQNGDTVRWEWHTSGYALEPVAQPPGADWTGTEGVHEEGFTYERQFTVSGDYRYRGYALETDEEMFGELVVLA